MLELTFNDHSLGTPCRITALIWHFSPSSAIMILVGPGGVCWELWLVADAENLDVSRDLEKKIQADEDFVEGLYLGDAIRFFLEVKRAGGRSERTLSEYRNKLDLFQRWAAGRVSR